MAGQYFWRVPDLRGQEPSSGLRPGSLSITRRHSRPASSCGGGVQVMQGRQQRKQWITDLNQRSPVTTSPVLCEVQSARWWLYDTWGIRDASDLRWWITVRWSRTLAKLKNCWLRELRDTSSCKKKHADVVNVAVGSAVLLLVWESFKMSHHISPKSKYCSTTKFYATMFKMLLYLSLKHVHFIFKSSRVYKRKMIPCRFIPK